MTLFAMMTCGLIGHSALKHALNTPEISLPIDHDIITIGDDCTVCYDRRTHTFRWVHERLTYEDLQGNAERSNNFFAPNVPDEFRPTLNDYRGTGYDRGHGAPAADFTSSQEAMNDSFSLANMMPQNSALNRGLWAAIEQEIRDMVQPGVTVHVVTVPIWAAHRTGGMQYEMAGRTHVPTHCGKAVLVISGGSVTAKTWIVPNAAPKRLATSKEFLTSVDDFERKSGVDIWSSLPDEIENVIEKKR